MLRNQITGVEGVHWIGHTEAVLETWQTQIQVNGGEINQIAVDEGKNMEVRKLKHPSLKNFDGIKREQRIIAKGNIWIKEGCSGGGDGGGGLTWRVLTLIEC